MALHTNLITLGISILVGTRQIAKGPSPLRYHAVLYAAQLPRKDHSGLLSVRIRPMQLHLQLTNLHDLPPSSVLVSCIHPPPPAPVPCPSPIPSTYRTVASPRWRCVCLRQTVFSAARLLYLRRTKYVYHPVSTQTHELLHPSHAVPPDRCTRRFWNRDLGRSK